MAACVWHVAGSESDKNSAPVCRHQSVGCGGFDPPPPSFSSVVVAPVNHPPSLTRPSHRHSGSKHGPLTPPWSLCVCISVSASLPVKTCVVSWAQLYTCYRLIGWLASTTFTPREVSLYARAHPVGNTCYSWAMSLFFWLFLLATTHI